MRAQLTETRLMLALLVAGLLAFWEQEDRPGFRLTAEPSSHSAIEVANTLAHGIEDLAYDDPRLAPTAAFAVPDGSLLPEAPGLRSVWRIVEHEPAQFMKTIEIRVRWSRRGRNGEIALKTVKAS